MLILEITSRAVITPVPAKAQGRRSCPTGITPPFIKNCIGRTQLRGELGLTRLRGTGSPIRLSVSRCQLLTVCCPLIRDRLQGFRNFRSLLKRDHFTLSLGCIFLFVPRRLCRRGVANRRSVLKADTPVYEYAPNTHTERNPVVTG